MRRKIIFKKKKKKKKKNSWSKNLKKTKNKKQKTKQNKRTSKIMIRVRGINMWLGDSWTRRRDWGGKKYIAKKKMFRFRKVV